MVNLPNLKSMYPSPPDITSIDLLAPPLATQLGLFVATDLESEVDDGLDGDDGAFVDMADSPP